MAVMTKSPRGDDIVILSRDEYDRLLAAGEDARDATTARRVIDDIESGAETVLSEAELDAFLNARSPLAFWREKRGLTQAELAKAAGIAQGFLSEIEAGKKPGTLATLRKIARALNVRVDDLLS